eukprot:154914-Pyramimonas_sp.AAC.1
MDVTVVAAVIHGMKTKVCVASTFRLVLSAAESYTASKVLQSVDRKMAAQTLERMDQAVSMRILRHMNADKAAAMIQ